MSLSIRILAAAASIIFLAESLLIVRVSHAADDCLTKPNAAPPQGKHWYYRIDRITQRKCWFLDLEGEKVRLRVHQPATVIRSAATAKVVTPKRRDAAPVESTPVKSTLIESTPLQSTWIEPNAVKEVAVLVVNSDESYASASPSQRMPETQISTPQEQSAREISEVTLAAPFDTAATQAPADSAISFGPLLVVVPAGLMLVGIILWIMFKFTSTQRSAPTKVRNSSSQMPKPSLRKHVHARHLGEDVKPDLRNIVWPERDATAPAAPENSGPEIETSVRRLLQELQRRQHQNERCRV